jgi:hypothetical protein
LIEALGLGRSLEHRGKVFLVITHGTLLVMIGLRPPALLPSRAHERTPRSNHKKTELNSLPAATKSIPAPHSV